MDFESAISGPIKHMLMRLIADNLPAIAMGIGALLALTAGFGLVKKLIAAIFLGTLRAGDLAAHKLFEKPKVVALATAILAIALSSAAAAYWFLPPKIVEKEVIREVEAIRYVKSTDPNGDLQKAEDARRLAVAAAKQAQDSQAAEAQARKDAETQAASLAKRLNDLSPPEGDEKALERLKTQIDAIHSNGVAEEAAPLTSTNALTGAPMLLGEDAFGRPIIRTMPVTPDDNPRAANYRNYKSYTHKRIGINQKIEADEIVYHAGRCSPCAANYKIRLMMDEIYPRLVEAAKQPRVVFLENGLVERIFPKRFGEGMEHKLYTKREYNVFLLAEKARRALLERQVTAFGETKSLSAWIDDVHCGLNSPEQIARRLDKGWPPEAAIATPLSIYGDDTEDRKFAEAKQKREAEAEAKKRRDAHDQLVREVEQEVKQGTHLRCSSKLLYCPCRSFKPPESKKPAPKPTTQNRLAGGH